MSAGGRPRYRAELLPAVRRYLRDLQRATRKRIGEAINALEIDPRPPGCKLLRGDHAGYLRIREGDYRVIYSCDDGALLILVVKVGDRKEIYR